MMLTRSLCALGLVAFISASVAYANDCAGTHEVTAVLSAPGR